MSEDTTMKRRVLFVLGSARARGTSEALALHAAAALPPEVHQDWKRLTDFPLQDFRYPGAAETGTGPTGNERVLLDATLEASDVVIVSPLYWYSVSAQTKLYLDYWGRWLGLPHVGFRGRMRGKTMWAVTTTGGEDTAKARPLLESLRLTADYLHMPWGGDVVGHNGTSGGVLASTDTLERASGLFATGSAPRPGTARRPQRAARQPAAREERHGRPAERPSYGVHGS
ncbi:MULTISPECIES: flavodoxin family protein [unclassified Streptomyces]|uniref:flavodoxin family protein n=1 Tax=unclassified Streptomyces TaxID=2593676 RepID=UPI0036E20DC4